ncbi:DUF58 domain-containing protein [Pyrodictium abyssi]|uniref:DUF58 domain-containing protein n=1 Tax=Pyrodictium abyssi TaxID=54256 RepID=A0ABN6ZJM3_9CREN|nr:hypothetical protein PABY_00230 [Pyrodictium abyssi]
MDAVASVRATPKGLAVLFAAAQLALLATAVESRVVVATLLALLSLAAASYADARRASRVLAGARVSRSASPSPAVEGTPVGVRVEVEGLGGLDYVLVEEEPLTRALDPAPRGPLLLPVEGGRAQGGGYTVRLGPGLSVSGHVVLGYLDPLGLFAARLRVYAPLAVPVYPAIDRSLAGVPGSGVGYSGGSTRRWEGPGMDLHWLRDYAPGDDPRRIAWRATARTGRLLVRVDEAEQEPRLHIFVDLTRGMWRGRAGEAPADTAMRLAASLAYAARRLGGLLGYTVYTGAAAATVPPGRAADTLPALLARLSSVNPLDTLPPSPAARLVLAEAAEAARAGGALLVAILGGDLCRAVFSGRPGLPRHTVVLVGPVESGCTEELRAGGYAHTVVGGTG